jgi:hypothetical protein
MLLIIWRPEQQPEQLQQTLLDGHNLKAIKRTLLVQLHDQKKESAFFLDGRKEGKNVLKSVHPSSQYHLFFQKTNSKK